MEIERLVLSGGGVKGLLYIGCLRAFEELQIKLNLREICGVSIGAVIGFLYVLGYTWEELTHEVMSKNFETLIKVGILNLYEYGIDDGEQIMMWLESLLLRKLNKTRKLTLKELYDISNIKLNIVATNLNTCRLEQFNWEMTPDLEVLSAIRMSISIPFLFTKKCYNDSIYVDGGVIMTYPITLYREDDLSKTLGIRFKKTGDVFRDTKVMDLEKYIYRVSFCYMYHKTNYERLSEEYLKCTISLDPKINTLTLNVTNEQKQELINSGYEQFRRIHSSGDISLVSNYKSV